MTAKRSSPIWSASSTVTRALSLFLTIFALNVASAADCAATAADLSDPAALVRHVGDSAIGLLTDSSLSDTDREQRVRQVLQDAFAVDTVGRFVLGHHWRRATPGQQDDYLVVFREYVVNSIAARFGDYSGERMRVVDQRDDHGKGTIVTTQIDSPVHGLVEVQWRVREVEGETKIIDIIVEGVSMLLTQRSEFAAVISSNGGNVDALIVQLRVKVDELKAKRPVK